MSWICSTFQLSCLKLVQEHKDLRYLSALLHYQKLYHVLLHVSKVVSCIVACIKSCIMYCYIYQKLCHVTDSRGVVLTILHHGRINTNVTHIGILSLPALYRSFPPEQNYFIIYKYFLLNSFVNKISTLM